MIRNRGRKFVRARATGCLTAWVDISGANELICCDANSTESLCQAASGNIFMTTWLSWVLPLLPLLIEFAAVSLAGSIATQMKHDLQRAQQKRLAQYLVLMAYRTFVLYFAFNSLQDAVQPAETAECAYAPQRADGLCRGNFDFADHVVLYFVHYVLIAATEMSSVAHLPILSVARRCSMVCSTVLLMAALHGIWRTASFFHTRAECGAGLALAVVCGGGLFHAAISRR